MKTSLAEKTLNLKSLQQDWRLWPVASSQLPPSPGVYWFSDSSKNILYVGKAKNLHNRLSNYKQVAELSPRIREMTREAHYVSWHILDSELEALLVEAELINLHQPPFNVLLKDDKSLLYVVITDETWPRVLKMRKRDLVKKEVKSRAVFGPFQSAYKVNEVLKIARKIFPWCNGARGKKFGEKACFYRHLGLCAGACEGKISETEYKEIIDNLALFLRGRHKEVMRQLKTEMKIASQTQKYELAARFRDQLVAVTEVTATKTNYGKGGSIQGLYLPRLYGDRVAQEGLVYLRQILHSQLNFPVESQINRIEGYDVSNTSGKNASVGMVVFGNGMADKSQYRLFNIKELNTPNDFAMMAEALRRRKNHGDDWPMPDLILIDGGKGQVRAVLKELLPEWASVPIIGLEKNPDRLVLPVITGKKQNDKNGNKENKLAKKTQKANGSKKQNERLEINWRILRLEADNPALKILEQVRDEAHRFSKKQHTRRRNKNLFD